MEGKQKRESFRKKAGLLAHHLRPAASAFALGIGASLAATLLRTLFTQIIRFTVDHALLGETDGLPAFLLDAPAGRILVWCAAAAATVALLEFGAGFVQDSNLPKGSERFVKSLRDALYGHIQRLPYSWHVQNPTGDIIQRCTSDVEVVRNFIAEQMVELLSTTFLIAVYMIAMFAMNVKISLFVFAFIPVIVGYSLVFYKRISKGYQKADEAEGELSSTVQENITGVRVVRAFGRERDELEKFQRKNNNYANIWMKLGDMMTVFWSLGDVMSMAQVFGVIAIGVQLCVKGEITLGTYLAFVSYTRQLTWPVRALGRTLSEMSKAGVSIDRLLYILGAETEKGPEAPAAANLSGDIRFEHVSFAYAQKKVLDDVSFTVKGGSTLGVFGETGSGKSTTLACMVDRINADQDVHIITIEDPIEYLHAHRRALVSQREIPNDACSFARALRAAMREAPDVIMLGEMRDYETVQTALTAAETGHFLLSSLHTVGAAKTIDRIIDTFPASQQQQVRVQLSMVLRAVVSQRLVPTVDGTQTPVFEVMAVNPAIQNMIRDGKTFQIDNVIYGGAASQAMLSMDNELIRLAKEGRITRETAQLYAVNPDMLRKRL